MKIAVIGGGIGGLTIAYLLSKEKHKVKLFEKTDALGGLARTITVDKTPIEVYYHHYNKTDTELFALCKELGIGLIPFASLMGYVSGGVIYDFNSPIDLLKFTPLAFKDKINFALSYFYKLEPNRKVYDIIWKPLLQHKFGEHYKNIRMRYIYSRPRVNGKLFYIEGSTQALIDKLRDKIFDNGGEIYLEQEQDNDKYDFVIDTTPCVKDMLGVTCIMLFLKYPLTKYYWLNIGDLSFPFGLIVQKGNIAYIVQYGKAKGDCIQHLTRINPDFHDSWIKEAHVFHDDYAQEVCPEIEDRGINNVIKKAYKTIKCCL